MSAATNTVTNGTDATSGGDSAAAKKSVKRNREAEQFQKLFVGGLTVNVTSDALKEYFSKYGEIIDGVVMKDSASKRSRGFGFVTFNDPKQLDAAMAARPHTIDGKVVEPKRAVPKELSHKPENHFTVEKLYVGGIRESHTEELLREYFSKFGTVTEVQFITDKGTGNKRAFGFVTFDDYDPVDKCVLQRSHVLGDGSKVEVKKALSREEMNRVAQIEQERDYRLRSGYEAQWAAAAAAGAHGYGDYGRGMNGEAIWHGASSGDDYGSYDGAKDWSGHSGPNMSLFHAHPMYAAGWGSAYPAARGYGRSRGGRGMPSRGYGGIYGW